MLGVMGLTQRVMAEGTVPLPSAKPATVHAVPVTGGGTVPLPGRKPHADVRVTRSVPAIPSADTLSSHDETLYRAIFAAQERGDMKAADAQIADLGNGILLGHVLAQRYLHPTAYRADFSELKTWLDRYGDHPEAERIYKLASARAPGGQGVKEPPAKTYITALHNAGTAPPKRVHKTSRKRNAAEQKAVETLTSTIRRQVQNNEPTQAWQALKNDPAAHYLDAVEHDSLHALVGAGYLYAAKFTEAEEHAAAAFKRSGKTAPVSGWIYGLSNWQLGRYDRAIHGFEVAATSPYSSGWMVSAASYWAARAHMRAGHHKQVSRWMKMAALNSRTFYGLLAQRALGQDFAFDWDAPQLTSARQKYIEATPEGKRAAALIRVGEIARAESELARFNVQKKKDGKEALMAYALSYNLPALALRLGNALSDKNKIYDAALYPLIPWEPKGGYKIDRALIHALVRQESRFNAAAENPSGATGLMQLMPSTATFIAGGEKTLKNLSLKDPSVNLELGQKYVESLLAQPSVDRDLLSLAIAYNAGPGKLAKWKSVRGEVKDPLLFIETIPYAETRAFVERVLSNYWIYRMRLDQPTPSLDAVVQGQWARYAAMDDGSVKFASR